MNRCKKEILIWSVLLLGFCPAAYSKALNNYTRDLITAIYLTKESSQVRFEAKASGLPLEQTDVSLRDATVTFEQIIGGFKLAKKLMDPYLHSEEKLIKKGSRDIQDSLDGLIRHYEKARPMFQELTENLEKNDSEALGKTYEKIIAWRKTSLQYWNDLMETTATSAQSLADISTVHVNSLLLNQREKKALVGQLDGLFPTAKEGFVFGQNKMITAAYSLRQALTIPFKK